MYHFVGRPGKTWEIKLNYKCPENNGSWKCENENIVKNIINNDLWNKLKTPLSEEDTTQKNIVIDRVWHDNPGKDWLENEIKYANSKYNPSKNKFIVGSLTAGFEGRLPTNMISSLPGENGEHKNREILTDFKSSPIKESIKKEGVKEPITIFVNHLGEAYISEGNHRTALANEFKLPDVPVDVRYFAGGELVDGPWKLDNFENKKGIK